MEDCAGKVIQFALDNGAQYCDVREESVCRNGFLIENGEIQHSISESDKGIGIRILADGAWGFCSMSEPISIDDLRAKVIRSVKTALYFSTFKKQKVNLAETRSFKENVILPTHKEPHIDEMIQLGMECDKIIREKKRIKKSAVAIYHDHLIKHFTNSDGSQISQSFNDVIATISATAYESGLAESVSTTEGGRGGMEMITEKNNLIHASKRISEKADLLLDAKTAKEEKTKIVMNPDFVALLTHEILGHPSEADRVLGKEMAWAGGAWWAGKLGTKIGSTELNVIDDPTISSSLGWYKYDDEGIVSNKKTLIQDGFLSAHMHSRETAAQFTTEPNSSMRATNYSFMPLIRMACTCITSGDWNPDEMIRDVKDGYLICDMKVPSIDMMRYNWNISCQYAYKIKNGETMELLRDVIVTGVSPEFFNSIDARGNDFTVRPITNCGKGDPMQIMRMGNGGPHMRAEATVKSVNL
ncbi:MAG: TldD/PmbA family protein [Nitrososphaera sp.]|jgi:TldD protein